MSAYVGSITTHELAVKLNQGTDNLVVFDVRDSDFKGGNIIGAVNIPSEEFRVRIQDTVTQYRDKDTIVVHCMMSQVRGPTCANMLAQELARQGNTQQKVVVLQGGFSNWAAVFAKEKPQLIENFIPQFYM